MIPTGTVYIITSISNPTKDYIGSTVNYLRRVTQHKTRLKSNQHNNPKLQNHINKHGISDLEFGMLEENIPDNELLGRENYYKYLFEPFFNCDEVDMNRKVRLSESTKRKMSISAMGNTNSDGHVPSIETRKKLSESKIGDKNPNWSGKYEYHYAEGLTNMQKRTYRNKIRRQTNKLIKLKN